VQEKIDHQNHVEGPSRKRYSYTFDRETSVFVCKASDKIALLNMFLWYWPVDVIRVSKWPAFTIIFSNSVDKLPSSSNPGPDNLILDMVMAYEVTLLKSKIDMVDRTIRDFSSLQEDDGLLVCHPDHFYFERACLLCLFRGIQKEAKVFAQRFHTRHIEVDVEKVMEMRRGIF
jgi:hypothetical protein